MSSHGHAIFFSTRLKSWMDIFLKEVCFKFAASDSGTDKCVFLSPNGESLVSSHINKAIKSVWKKAKVEGAPSSTSFTKSTVSSVHSSSDSNEARGHLADLMFRLLQDIIDCKKSQNPPS